MADGPFRFQQGAGPYFFTQHNQSHHTRHLQQRTSSPVNTGRAGYNADTPSPSRSPGPQSPAHNPYSMYGQGHAQNHNVFTNGAQNHQQFAMRMNMAKQYGQQNHHQNHHHQQHQDHAQHGGQGGNYGGHQHNISSGGLSNAAPHFTPNHAQNGTPNNMHSNLNKPANEHWALILQMADQSRQSMITHAHARQHPNVNKSMLAGVSNGSKGEAEKEERNRAEGDTSAGARSGQSWTALDLGGQALRVISPQLFDYSFLTKLFVNHNKLTFLPSTIGKLRSLNELDVSQNELTELPAEIGMLTNLREFLLFDNHLATLPAELGYLYQLQILGIENNPIPEELKSIIVESGTRELVKYLREQAQEPEPPNDRDLIVVDDTPVNADDKFTVLNYNILCDKYCTQSQYGYTPSRALAWEHRREVVLDELRARNADIICLQEIDQASFNDFFRPNLAHHDYKGVFWPKSRARTMVEKEANRVDGCATFYKNKKYILLDKQLIDFANTAINRPDMKGEHDIFNRVMPRDDIAVLAFFENRLTGTRLMVVNAHVFWNEVFKDVKTIQVAILMEQITKLAERYTKTPPCMDKKVYRYTNVDNEDEQEQEIAQELAPSVEYSQAVSIPLLICGDFNSKPGSGVYDLITQGSLSHAHADLGNRKYGNFTRDGMAHPFSIKSSYSHIGELSFTNYTPGFTGVIDYIWYSATTLQVTSLLGEIDKQYLQRVPGFPNFHFPSDHLALFAEFVVKKGREKKVVEADFGPQRDRHN